MKLVKPDYIPMLHDAGLDQTILASFSHAITINDLRIAVNGATKLNVDIDDLKQYLADIGGLGLKVVDGELPKPTARPAAPTGLGQDDSAIWFTTPDKQTCTVRWYVNGELMTEREQDCKSDRSIDKLDLETKLDDVVQVCVVDKGVVGWWSRIKIK